VVLHEHDCKKVVVAREAPTACPCGGTNFEQDTDVLDTWFSVWPFAVHHAGLAAGDARRRSVLSQFAHDYGFDILFFWVARMIMLGCWFMTPPHRPE